jgi:hypothetical protein
VIMVVDRTHASAEGGGEIPIDSSYLLGDLTTRYCENVTAWESKDEYLWTRSRSDYFVPKSESDICAHVYKYQRTWESIESRYTLSNGRFYASSEFTTGKC